MRHEEKVPLDFGPGSVTIVGGKGATLSLRADGTGESDYGTGTEYLGAVGTQAVRLVVSGRVTFGYTADDGSARLTDIDVQAKAQAFVDGVAAGAAEDLEPVGAATVHLLGRRAHRGQWRRADHVRAGWLTGSVGGARTMVGMRWTVIDSPIGALSVASDGVGVSGVHFGAVEEPGPIDVDAVLPAAVEELRHYFAGTLTDFTVPISVPRGSPFERAVWREMSLIPYGETRTYGAVAAAVGDPDGRAGGGGGLQPQPDPGDRAVPPHRRGGRQAGRLRRRPAPQASPAGAGGEGRPRPRLGRVRSTPPDGAAPAVVQMFWGDAR